VYMCLAKSIPSWVDLSDFFPSNSKFLGGGVFPLSPQCAPPASRIHSLFPFQTLRTPRGEVLARSHPPPILEHRPEPHLMTTKDSPPKEAPPPEMSFFRVGGECCLASFFFRSVRPDRADLPSVSTPPPSTSNALPFCFSPRCNCFRSLRDNGPFEPPHAQAPSTYKQ